MKILVLGHGIANDGVILLLNEENMEYDYLDIKDVTHINYDLVVKAPGIPYTEKIIADFEREGIPIITDIEVAMSLRKKFYIGITGSNGKTTVTSLITKILNQKYKAIACGNIGYSVCKAVVEEKDADIFVVELSSFALERAKLDLNISVLLNLHPCHLDHHKDFKDYCQSKSNICMNQSSLHYCIYNSDESLIREIVSQSAAKKIAFSKDSIFANCSVFNKCIYFKNKKIYKLPLEILNKEHMIYNLMASIAATTLIKGIHPKHIQRGIREFEEIEYRLTKINDYIYNDAKSTNPYSTIAALKCFEQVELICGGYDRKENLDCLTDSLNKVKKVYAFGATKDKIKTYMENHQISCETFSSLQEAFMKACKERESEVILFSPMFASFDHFKNYMERGKYFTELANEFLNEKIRN